MIYWRGQSYVLLISFCISSALSSAPRYPKKFRDNLKVVASKFLSSTRCLLARVFRFNVILCAMMLAHHQHLRPVVWTPTNLYGVKCFVVIVSFDSWQRSRDSRELKARLSASYEHGKEKNVRLKIRFNAYFHFRHTEIFSAVICSSTVCVVIHKTVTYKGSAQP